MSKKKPSTTTRRTHNRVLPSGAVIQVEEHDLTVHRNAPAKPKRRKQPKPGRSKVAAKSDKIFAKLSEGMNFGRPALPPNVVFLRPEQESQPATKPARQPKAKPAEGFGFGPRAIMPAFGVLIVLMGMLGSGALDYSVLNALLDGLGIFGVFGIVAGEYVGGHCAFFCKGWRQKAGVMLAFICMAGGVGLAITREDHVSRHEAHVAQQQTAPSEAMEDCSSKDIPKGLGSPDRLNAEQTRVNECNARNEGRATRADAKVSAASDKAAKRSGWELFSLIALSLVCSWAAILGAGAFHEFVEAVTVRRK